MTKIFADSNFFIALFNPLDTLHSAAVDKSKEIEVSTDEVTISNFVFSEIVTVLSQRADREVAVRNGNNLLRGQATVVCVDDKLQDSSWRIFEDIKKKNMSFVDCSILAVMQAEGINKLLTFDKEDFSSLRSKYDFSFF